MSFATDLEAHLETVQSCSESERHCAEELTRLLQERAMYEDCYAAGLERVAESVWRQERQGELARIVAALKTDCRVRAEAGRKISRFIVEDLVHSLKSLLQTQSRKQKSLQKSLASAEKLLQSHKSSLESTQQHYHKQFRTLESLALRLESVKSVADKRKVMTPHTPDSVNKALQTAVESYKSQLETYNQFLGRYREERREMLRDYQEIEEERLEAMGSAVRRLWEVTADCESAFCDHIKEESDTYTHFYPQYDISQFIAETVKLPSFAVPDPAVFLPYRGSHPKFLGESLPDLEFPIEDAPGEAKPKAEFDTEVEKSKVEKLMNTAWNDVLCPRQLGEIRKIVRDARGRRLWVVYMNSCRAEGKFRLSDTGFISVAEIMNIVLDECEATDDIATSKCCIILSQTFHHCIHTEKEFLQAKIVRHTIWRRASVWDAIVKDGIATEVAKRREYKGENGLGDLCNLVFSQLSSYAYVMSLFEVEARMARAILQRLCAEYRLSGEETAMLVEMSSPEASPVKDVTRHQSSDSPLSFSPVHQRQNSLVASPARLSR